MARKYLIAEDDLHTSIDLSEDELNDYISDEEKFVIKSDHNTDSEQEYDGNSDSEFGADPPDSEFYLGKDQTSKWYKTNETIISKVKTEPSQDILPGPNEMVTELTSEISAFDLLVDTQMIEDIVKYTNIYIDFKNSTVKCQNLRDVKVTTKTEILALLGLMYLIGVKQCTGPLLELWDLDTGFIITRQTMSYQRFCSLLTCIQFDDHRTREERKMTDNLADIRNIFEAFVTNCKKTYSLGKYVTIDERVEPFRGRCSFIQYLPKSAKYGLKMFVLCDAKTHYVSNVEVYCGEQPEGPYKVLNTPSEIVTRLIDPIKGSNRNLTTDNWYTSVPLAQMLLNDYNITLLGTLTLHEMELPPQFLPGRNREIKSSLFGFQDNITLVSYVTKKNKSVILVSTMHGSGKIDPESGKPEIILDYNATKGVVDTMDQMCATYTVKRGTRRWPVVIFSSIMNMAGINAHILYSHNQKITRKDFLKNLAMSLIKPFLTERANITTFPLELKASLAKYKTNVRDLPKPEAELKRKGRCRTCGRHKNMNTTIRCDTCRDFVCKQHAIYKISCEKCSSLSYDSD